MQTLDPIQTGAPPGALASPAVARNTEAILDVLRAHLPAAGRVLEIASGSGEHAVAFARALPRTTWTPSDPSAEARASIAAWSAEAALSNLNRPLALDAADPDGWPPLDVQAIVCINNEAVRKGCQEVSFSAAGFSVGQDAKELRFNVVGIGATAKPL